MTDSLTARAAAPPVIGISAYAEPAQWAGWHEHATLVPHAYVDRVAAAGCVPVVLPPVPGVEQVAGRLDGLLLTGGGDVDPGLHAARRHPRTARVYPERDAAELALLRAAFGAGLPVLGICRGLQVLNVVRGGTLVQHLPEHVGHDGHAPGPRRTGRGRSRPHRAAASRRSSAGTRSACPATTIRRSSGSARGSRLPPGRTTG
jgi:putative glutamine amidotransferase